MKNYKNPYEAPKLTQKQINNIPIEEDFLGLIAGEDGWYIKDGNTNKTEKLLTESGGGTGGNTENTSECANALKESIITNEKTITLTDVSPIEHDISIKIFLSKNLAYDTVYENSSLKSKVKTLYAGKTYTISFYINKVLDDNGKPIFGLITLPTNEEWGCYADGERYTATFTMTEDKTYENLSFFVGFSNDLVKCTQFQIEEGSQATDYVPGYAGEASSIPIQITDNQGRNEEIIVTTEGTNFKSSYPNTIITSIGDVQSAFIITYNKDINSFSSELKSETEMLVKTEVAALVDSAPETLNTLNEISKALNDDPSFAITVMNELNKKADKNIVINSANAIKKTFYATSPFSNISIKDMSSIQHNLDIKISSKNLLTYPYTETTITKNGITFTDNGDGSITVNGTSTNSGSIYFSIAHLSNLEVGSTYTFTGCPAGGGQGIAYLRIYDNGYPVSYYYDYGNGVTFSPRTSAVSVRLYVAPGATVENLTFYPQIELGEIASEYTQYKNNLSNIDIVSNGGETETLLDGSVEGIVSVYPSFGLSIPTELSSGYLITIKYNQDINKAFDDVKNYIDETILGGAW